MEPCVFIIDKKDRPKSVLCSRVSAVTNFKSAEFKGVEKTLWTDTDSRITFSTGSYRHALLARICLTQITVGAGFDVRTGLQAYETGKGTPPQSKQDVLDHVFDCRSKIDKSCLRYLEGQDVGRYDYHWSGMWMKYGPWLSQPRNLEIFSRPRVLIREITSSPPYCINASLFEDVFLNNKSILNVLDAEDSLDRLKVLAAILNSRFMSECYKAFAVKAARKIFPKIVIRNLREFPLPKCLAVGKPKTKKHDEIIFLVDQITLLKAKFSIEKNPNTRDHLSTMINATNHKIDRSVYEIYGLSIPDIELLEQES
jgi:hypothetical protein